jgi:predicted nucleotidyltransferase component of viral defense system
MDFSREFGLVANVIEKDYVLGWVLAGIFNHPAIASSWFFKGGTCLKKCYFETYRFSEDLDFTLTNPEHMDEGFLTQTFAELSDWVYEATGIEVPKDKIRFEVLRNPREGTSAQGRLAYRGPLQPRGDLPRIKLDLTPDEVLVLEPSIQEVHHPYSDRPPDGIHIACYRFEEVFAEKIRALAERERPRDLYDVIHLFRHHELNPDRNLVLSTLEKKCAFKGISVPTIAILETQPERLELESEWENMLAHQLPVLPPFEHFWQELPSVFDWLHTAIEKVVQPPMPFGRESVNETWRPPSMATAWNFSTPLELIRYAAANRLCVDLAYQGSRRLIEPYSLRQTKDGNLLLYAVRHQTGEDRSYRVDRIQGAQVTRTTYAPRYLVELTPSGPISAPPLERRSSDFGFWGSRKPRTTRLGLAPKASRYRPKYIFSCLACNKRFTRTSYNASLNAHKNKQGYPCPGRMGMYITTSMGN